MSKMNLAENALAASDSSGIGGMEDEEVDDANLSASKILNTSKNSETPQSMDKSEKNVGESSQLLIKNTDLLLSYRSFQSLQAVIILKFINGKILFILFKFFILDLTEC